MKRIMICILSAILICGNISGASAATTNTMNVSFKEIEDIMINNSPEMKIADNNLKKAEEQYKEDMDSDNVDIQEDIIDKKEDEYDKALQEYNANKSAENEEKIDIAKSQLKDSKKTLKEFKKGKEQSKYTLKLAKIGYDKTIKNSVLEAQRQYIEYLNSLSKKEIAKKNLDSKNKESDSNKMKYEMGFISQKEYNSKVTGNVELDNSFQELVKKQEIDLKNLHLVLGIPLTTQIIINDDVNVDLDKVSKINFKEDLDIMLKNNIDIKTKDIESEKTDISDEEYDIDNAEISLKQQKENTKLEFEKKYNDLMNSYNTLKNSNTKLNEKQYEFGIMQNKYSYGFISNKQVDDLEAELDKQKLDFVSEKNNFYVSYLQYLQMKEGY